MHSRGLELTKLTYTRLEDNQISHRGDRLCIRVGGVCIFDSNSQKVGFHVNAVEPNSVRQAVIVPLRNLNTAARRHGQAVERHRNLSAPHCLTLPFTPRSWTPTSSS